VPTEKQKLLSQLERWLSIVQIRTNVSDGLSLGFYLDLQNAFEMVIRFLKEEG
jgi:23S rRNA G2069 N7-methylase RlmK/C1962 C5-methylase RlmI